MPKDGTMPSARSKFVDFLKAANLFSNQDRKILLKKNASDRVSTLLEDLKFLLNGRAVVAPDAEVYARALVLAILADADNPGVTEEARQAMVVDTVWPLLSDYPMEKFPGVRRVLIKSLIDIWLTTGRGLMLFVRRTQQLAELEDVNLQVAYDLIRHSTISRNFFTDARAVLQATPKGDSRRPSADKLIKALDFNRLANMSDASRQCFADLAECMERAPSFVRDELVATAKRYEGLFGLEESLLELLEREAVDCHIEIDRLEKTVELIPHGDAGLDLAIEFAGDLMPLQMAVWATHLVFDLLPSVLKGRAEQLQAPENLGIAKIVFVFRNTHLDHINDSLWVLAQSPL